MKQKLKIAIYILAVISTISCNNGESKENTTIVNIDNVKPIHKKGIVVNEDEPQIVALKFYEWYLKDIYLKKFVESPDIVLTKDSIYVLDATNHKKFIETCGYVSEKFYENELAIFKDCEDKLRLVKWKDVEESGAVNPAEYVTGNECEFTHYMIWTNGQGESINKAEIEKFTTKADKSLVVLKLSDSLYGGFSKSRVSMVKENGKWKISKIDATF